MSQSGVVAFGHLAAYFMVHEAACGHDAFASD